MMIKNILIFLIIFIILYLYLSITLIKHDNYDIVEENGNKILFHNLNSGIVSTFDSIKDYLSFMDLRNEKGVNNPVLYFKRIFTTQNDLGSKQIPDPSSDIIYFPKYEDKSIKRTHNMSNVVGFDPTDQDIGVKNSVDMRF